MTESDRKGNFVRAMNDRNDRETYGLGHSCMANVQPRTWIGGLTYTTNVTLDDLVTDALEAWLSRLTTAPFSNPFRSPT